MSFLFLLASVPSLIFFPVPSGLVKKCKEKMSYRTREIFQFSYVCDSSWKDLIRYDDLISAGFFALYGLGLTKM